jgi:putative inorganic carbon (HCO3(-)) transporter
MSYLIKQMNDRLVPALGLDAFDGVWEKTLNRSRFASVWFSLKSALSAKLASWAKFGTGAQWLSYVAVVMLFAVIAAPQFASDKEVLAVLVVGAYGLRVIGSMCAGRETYVPSALDMVLLAFLATNLIATGASHYLLESVKGLAKLLVYIAGYFLFAGVLQHNTKNRIFTIWAALIAGAFLVSLYGLYQYKIGVAPLATWEDPNVEDKATRIYSTLNNPNLLAGYLLPLIPVSFALTMATACASGWKRLLSLPFLGATAAIAVATLLTGSRGGYLGLAGVAAVLGIVSLLRLWREKPKLRPLVLLAVVLIPVAMAVVVHAMPSVEHRIVSMLAGREHSSNSYRFNVWQSSWQMFLDNWWFGIGPGNSTFKLAYGLYMRSGFDALGTYCVPLEVAVEAGILGLASFAWLILAVLARAHRTFWTATDAQVRWLAVGAAGAISGMMMHGLVDTVFYRPQVQLVFWLMVASVVALSLMRKHTSSPVE